MFRKQSAILFRIALFFHFLASIYGASLNSETLKAWDDYIATVNLPVRDQLNSGRRFLWVDGSPDQVNKLRAGETVVLPASTNVPREIPSGLIHDWIGAIFIPGVTLSDVVPVVRDYGRYSDFYKPSVIASRSVSLSESEDRFSIRLANRGLFRKSALDADYRVSLVRLDDRRRYAISSSTRIQEITEFGGNGQHELPADQGTGLIWRLFGVTRYEEREGGVYIEIEAIALSRDIPASLRWLVEPIVRRVAKASLTNSLQQTRDAVKSSGSLANRTVAVRH